MLELGLAQILPLTHPSVVSCLCCALIPCQAFDVLFLPFACMGEVLFLPVVQCNMKDPRWRAGMLGAGLMPTAGLMSL